MKKVFLDLLALVLVALTQGGGEIPPELQTEIDAITAEINAMGENPDAPVDQTATNELAQKITDIAEKIKDDSAKTKVNNKITDVKVAAVNVAIRAFETKQKNLGSGQAKAKNMNFDALAKNNGKLKVYNANNGTFTKTVEWFS